jgi:hypothetical protein
MHSGDVSVLELVRLQEEKPNQIEDQVDQPIAHTDILSVESS